MASYLLGTTCLLDIARNNHGPAHRWYLAQAAQKGLFPVGVVISAFSIARIEMHFVENAPRNLTESILRDNVINLIHQFRVDADVVGASAEVIDYWTNHLSFSVPYPRPGFPDEVLGFEEKFVVATAKVGNEGRGYSLVDHQREIHTLLGVLVIDPYA